MPAVPADSAFAAMVSDADPGESVRLTVWVRGRASRWPFDTPPWSVRSQPLPSTPSAGRGLPRGFPGEIGPIGLNHPGWHLDDHGRGCHPEGHAPIDLRRGGPLPLVVPVRARDNRSGDAMPKALFGHLGGTDPRLVSEVTRLRVQVKTLEAALEKSRSERDALLAAHLEHQIDEHLDQHLEPVSLIDLEETAPAPVPA